MEDGLVSRRVVVGREVDFSDGASFCVGRLLQFPMMNPKREIEKKKRKREIGRSMIGLSFLCCREKKKREKVKTHNMFGGSFLFFHYCSEKRKKNDPSTFVEEKKK